MGHAQGGQSAEAIPFRELAVEDAKAEARKKIDKRSHEIAFCVHKSFSFPIIIRKRFFLGYRNASKKVAEALDGPEPEASLLLLEGQVS